ncbi:MAG: hypothetical protein JNM63_04015, partial [Spirochaetia bacterium]|nr:hypothetical protein [Spirochaetia bacterium]
MNHSLIYLLGGGLVLMITLMSVVWWLHIPRKNAGLVDVAWSFGLGLLSLFYFFATRWSDLILG